MSKHGPFIRIKGMEIIPYMRQHEIDNGAEASTHLLSRSFHRWRLTFARREE
jgi:hypothetical protein